MTDIDVNLDELDIDSEELSTEDSAHMQSIAVEPPVKKERKPRAKKNSFAEVDAAVRDEGREELAGHQPKEWTEVTMAAKGQPVCQVPTKPLARLMQMRKELKSILPDSHAEEGYTYVSLSKVIRTVTDVAYAYGFAIVEELENSVVAAKLVDIENSCVMARCSEELLPRAAYARIQDRGAEITYARRYVYMSLVGITVDRDNDGKVAKPNTTVLAPKGSVDNTKVVDMGPMGMVVKLSSPQTAIMEVVPTPKELTEAIDSAQASIIAALGQPVVKTPEEKKASLLDQLRFQWEEMKAANKTHLVTEHNFKIIEAVCKGERTLKDDMLSTTCAHLAAKMAGK